MEERRASIRGFVVKRACLLLMLVSLPAVGADYAKCAAIASGVERLACYDLAAAPVVAPSPVALGRVEVERQAGHADTAESLLGSRWELDESAKKGPLHFREHKPVYILPLHYSNNPNRSPSSPAPGHSALEPMPIGSSDMKYQLSFKTKLWEDLFGDNGSLWFAYTQQSHWLLYDQQVSTPFRETNYEPELIFSLRTDVDLPGMRWRMLNLGLVHQSNGRGLPLSRSWNRAYAQFGLERGNLSLLLRPWIRLPEKSGENNDDNPDITSFMGHGDVQVNYRDGDSVYSAMGRYSGPGGKGAVQLSWGFPISHALKGYVQVFNGYGESMIDYNHNQTSIGFGLSLQE